MRAISTLALYVLLTMCCAAARGQGNVPQAEALRNMFERMAKQSEQFAPGLLSELSDEEMARLERVKIAPRQEAQFGESVLKNYEATLRAKNVTITRDGELVDYLRALVDDVRKHTANARRYARIDVALVESEETDAYSVPGGHLIFTRGLIDSLQSEAELVGIIAHELSHLEHGHQLLALKQSKSMPQMNDPRLAMQWMATMFKPFRPEFETQADSDAFKWMLAAGYDPRELANLLDRWEARQAQQAAWTKMLPDFVRSHPDPGRRARSIHETFNKLRRPPQDLVIGRQNLAQRIPSSQRKLAD
jgi:beta-barrel assembly-enhancing protease